MLALLRLGVLLRHQHYFGMQDGKLHTPQNRALLANRLGSLVTKHKFAAILTPGEDGFDGHTDHIAVHQAVVETAKSSDHQPAIWGVDVHEPDVKLTVDIKAKLARLADHDSQFEGADQPVPPIGTIESLAGYEHFLRQEGLARA